MTYAERIELEGIVDRIAACEAEVSALEAKLSNPSTYGQGADRQEPANRLRARRAEVETLTARWEDLEARSVAR